MTCHHYHNMKYYRKQINLSCVYCFCSFAFKNHVSYHVSFKFMLECFTESSVIIIVPLKKCIYLVRGDLPLQVPLLTIDLLSIQMQNWTCNV